MLGLRRLADAIFFRFHAGGGRCYRFQRRKISSMAFGTTVTCSPAPKTIGRGRLGSLLGAPEQLAGRAARTLSSIPTASDVAGLGEGTHSGAGNFTRHSDNAWPTGTQQRLLLVMVETHSIGLANRPSSLLHGRELRADLGRQSVPSPMAHAPPPR